VERQLLREVEGFAIFSESVDDGAAYHVAIDNAPESVPPDVNSDVPDDHVFVMGDNRYNAYDCRATGSIPFSSIIGRVIWP